MAAPAQRSEDDAARLYRPVVIHGEHSCSSAAFFELIERHLAHSLRDADVDAPGAIAKARRILFESSGIEERHFARPLESLLAPLTPQGEAELYTSVGLEMAAVAIKGALHEAGRPMDASDLSAIILVSHSPYPFPPLTSHLSAAFPALSKDCLHLPVTTMGCAGGAFALGAAYDHVRAHPDAHVLVLSVELCSFGFRPHRNGMSWFLNAMLFGDAVAAAVVSGPRASHAGDAKAGLVRPAPTTCMHLIQRAQRHVGGTTDVSFFEYDAAGYHFVTTPALCEVVAAHVPGFARDLARRAFNGKKPHQLRLCVIHPGGMRMVKDCARLLELEGTESEAAAIASLRRGGNLASATVLDMLAEAWDSLVVARDVVDAKRKAPDEVLVIGMGPGFVMTGVALRCCDERRRRWWSSLSVSSAAIILLAIAGALVWVVAMARWW